MAEATYTATEVEQLRKERDHNAAECERRGMALARVIAAAREGIDIYVHDTELAAELAKLRAALSRIPKTEDGAPIAPGMDVWRTNGGPARPIRDVRGWQIGDDGKLDALFFADGFTYFPGKLYSTEAAARAAAERDGGK